MGRAQVEYEEIEKYSNTRRIVEEGFNGLMRKLEQDGFDRMVREGFIVADETEYQV